MNETTNKMGAKKDEDDAHVILKKECTFLFPNWQDVLFQLLPAPIFSAGL